MRFQFRSFWVLFFFEARVVAVTKATTQNVLHFIMILVFLFFIIFALRFLTRLQAQPQPQPQSQSQLGQLPTFCCCFFVFVPALAVIKTGPASGVDAAVAVRVGAVALPCFSFATNSWKFMFNDNNKGSNYLERKHIDGAWRGAAALSGFLLKANLPGR